MSVWPCPSKVPAKARADAVPLSSQPAVGSVMPERSMSLARQTVCPLYEVPAETDSAKARRSSAVRMRKGSSSVPEPGRRAYWALTTGLGL